MAIERVYNVPLRKGYMKAPMYRRTKKAVNTLRTFVARNMKVSEDDVKLGKYVNLELWKHGIKNPPHHVKVNVKKDDEGNVFAELVGAPVEEAPAVTSKKAVSEAEEAKAALSGAGRVVKDAEIVEEAKFDEQMPPAGYQTSSINKAYISKKPSALESAAGFGEEKAHEAASKTPKSSAAKKPKKEEKSK